MSPPLLPTVTVSAKGAARWRQGHPWIYRSDTDAAARVPAGIVRVTDARGKLLGQALWSPRSEIRLRLLASDDRTIDTAWWADKLRVALARRATLAGNPTAFRVVHGEGDGLPSLIVDKYAEYAVAQILSAGLDAVKGDVTEALREVLAPTALLYRNDASVRRHEGLALETTDAFGTVPDDIVVREAVTKYRAAPRSGQKTGAFLDQRENRLVMGELAHGRVLDAFTYHGLFAIHAAARSTHIVAVDSSAPALEAARRNAELNGVTKIEWREANAFDLLREMERSRERFDTIVLDPPAFAKKKDAVERALAGYKEINLRAMRLLAPGGVLFTASCSFHVGRQAFLRMLAEAAADSGRRVALERVVGQAADHPELLTVPETGYLKGAILTASA